METNALRLAIAAGCGFAAFAVHAQSISPNNVSATIGVGESITIHKTITLGERAATNVDVFFLADNTGSMSSTINAAKAGANAIVGGLPSTFQYGVGRYVGDPSEGVAPATAYQTIQTLTTNTTLIQNGINAWFASGGGDTPKATTSASSRWRARPPGGPTRSGSSSGSAMRSRTPKRPPRRRRSARCRRPTRR